MTVRCFEDLEVWKEARALCVEIWHVTSEKPWNCDQRFREQVRSSAGSVMDNIAEGFERDNRKEFINFLVIAKGSCGELRSQVHRAKDTSHITEERYQSILEQTHTLSRKLSSFIKYLKTTEIKGLRYKPPAKHQPET